MLNFSVVFVSHQRRNSHGALLLNILFTRICICARNYPVMHLQTSGVAGNSLSHRINEEIMSLQASWSICGWCDDGGNRRTSMSVDATNLYSRNKRRNVVGTYWVNIWVSKTICVSRSRSTAAENGTAVAVSRNNDFTTIRIATIKRIFGIFLMNISPPSRSSGCSITTALSVLKAATEKNVQCDKKHKRKVEQKLFKCAIHAQLSRSWHCYWKLFSFSLQVEFSLGSRCGGIDIGDVHAEINIFLLPTFYS